MLAPSPGSPNHGRCFGSELHLSEFLLQGPIATVGLHLRTDAGSAMELSARRRLDGFVIDCDDVSGAPDMLAKIRSSRSNEQSVVVAVVNGTTTVSTAVKAGADFTLRKPVQDKQLRSCLDVALPRLELAHGRRCSKAESWVSFRLRLLEAAISISTTDKRTIGDLTIQPDALLERAAMQVLLLGVGPKLVVGC